MKEYYPNISRNTLTGFGYPIKDNPYSQKWVTQTN